MPLGFHDVDRAGGGILHENVRHVGSWCRLVGGLGLLEVRCRHHPGECRQFGPLERHSLFQAQGKSRARLIGPSSRHGNQAALSRFFPGEEILFDSAADVQTIVDPQDAAESAGLRYVSDARPGIGRRRSGKGFTYTGADGSKLVAQGPLTRIKSLAIPPAWTDVWICPFADGHIQATGRDAKGRKQYRYHL
jgi:Bacterial DNA topoisomerase IB, N-terminal domain